ncbi:MAG: hypothetical protein K8W52_23100 [Deltaproteobacteria bacterium]|nr:hypothetical protein [Deltaproteobacteria bacterium]
MPRAPLAALLAALTLAIPARARASCDGCCDARRTLVGWSDDARTFATIEAVDGEERLVVERDDGRGGTTTLAAWSSYRDADPAAPDDIRPVCVDPAPRIARDRGPGTLARLDVATAPELRAFQLRPVARAWRDAFDLAITPAGSRRFVDPHRLPYPFVGSDDGVACSTWALTPPGATRPRSWLPRSCDPDGTDTPAIDVRGGYRHPTRPIYLVKLRLDHIGLATSDQFVLVAAHQ